MSWLYSRVLVAEYSAGICLAGEPSVESKAAMPKPEPKTKKAGGDTGRVSSVPLPDDSDSAGVFEPGAAAKFEERLIAWTMKQFDNIDGLNWVLAASVFLKIGDDCPSWN